MPHGYDVLTGILVAVIVIVMIGGAFGRSPTGATRPDP